MIPIFVFTDEVGFYLGSVRKILMSISRNSAYIKIKSINDPELEIITKPYDKDIVDIIYQNLMLQISSSVSSIDLDKLIDSIINIVDYKEEKEES